MSYSSDLPIF